MEFTTSLENKRIRFHFLVAEPELLNNLSFLHLVMMKFDGIEHKCRSFQNDGNDKYIEIVIEFTDYSLTANADAHCKQNINGDGNIVTAYKGALKKVDPSNRMAKSIKNRALKKS
jgi:hypothetical protein